MNIKNKTIGVGGIIAILATGGVAIDKALCITDISLETTTTDYCLDDVEYKDLKDKYLEGFNDGGYDVDINDIELLDQVVKKETKGGFTLQTLNKRQDLINILNK